MNLREYLISTFNNDKFWIYFIFKWPVSTAESLDAISNTELIFIVLLLWFMADGGVTALMLWMV